MSAWADLVLALVWGAAFGSRRKRAARAIWLGRFCRTTCAGSGLRCRLRWCRWRRPRVLFAPAGQVERRASARRLVAAFNGRHRVGDQVLYRPVLGLPETRGATVRGEAFIDAGGQPVVQLAGIRGGTFHVLHVEAGTTRSDRTDAGKDL